MQPPLCLVPQHFGSLVFDRRSSRYLPFDQEATALLLTLHREPISAVVARIASSDEREATTRFFDSFYARGFFTLEGRLAATVLEVDVPTEHLVGPLATHLEIIGACNLACTHCFAGMLPRNHNPLTLPELSRLFTELASLGSFRLGLTGGEPLLRKDLFEILDAAVAAGLHPCLTTNGLLVTEEIARKLGQRPLVWLNVSMEGPDAQSNDLVRGAGTFEQLRPRLRLLAQHARFTLAFTIMRHNAHLVGRCAELARDVGAHSAVFRPLYPAGTALSNLDLMPSFSQYQGALRTLFAIDLADGELRGLDPFSPESRQESAAQIHTSHTCGAGQHVCSISVQGEVSACSFLGSSFSAGNVRNSSFAAIWRHSPQLKRMRESTGEFQGGCRARSQTFAGSVDAPDPWYEEFRRHSSSVAPGANVELMRRRVTLPILSAD